MHEMVLVMITVMIKEEGVIETSFRIRPHDTSLVSNQSSSTAEWIVTNGIFVWSELVQLDYVRLVTCHRDLRILILTFLKRQIVSGALGFMSRRLVRMEHMTPSSTPVCIRTWGQSLDIFQLLNFTQLQLLLSWHNMTHVTTGQTFHWTSWRFRIFRVTRI